MGEERFDVTEMGEVEKTAYAVLPESKVEHAWQYSFVSNNDFAYVVGYCPDCDIGFSSSIPLGIGLSTEKLGIERYGCNGA